jgi:hypothetical protein
MPEWAQRLSPGSLRGVLCDPGVSAGMSELKRIGDSPPTCIALEGCMRAIRGSWVEGLPPGMVAARRGQISGKDFTGVISQIAVSGQCPSGRPYGRNPQHSRYPDMQLWPQRRCVEQPTFRLARKGYFARAPIRAVFRKDPNAE